MTGGTPVDGNASRAAANAAASFVPRVANVPTGVIVTAANIDEHLALLPPGIEWAVRRGLRLRVIGSRPIQPPRLPGFDVRTRHRGHDRQRAGPTWTRSTRGER